MNLCFEHLKPRGGKILYSTFRTVVYLVRYSRKTSRSSLSLRNITCRCKTSGQSPAYYSHKRTEYKTVHPSLRYRRGLISSRRAEGVPPRPLFESSCSGSEEALDRSRHIITSTPIILLGHTHHQATGALSISVSWCCLSAVLTKIMHADRPDRSPSFPLSTELQCSIITCSLSHVGSVAIDA
jgi:hypothetical protein